MKKRILLSIFLLISLTNIAQTECKLNKSDWEKVKIHHRDSVQIDHNFVKAKCDVVLNISPVREIISLNDLTEDEIETLKKRAAKYKCCSIVLDIRNKDNLISISGAGYRNEF